MNGKIKTKFAALFAVALMITVCVVPVVGNDGTDAAPVSSTNGEVFEGYDITLYKEGGDYSGLVYYGEDPKIAGYTVKAAISGDNAYYYNPETEKFLTVDQVPGYVPTKATYGFPMIQFVYSYDDADVNTINYTVKINKDNVNKFSFDTASLPDSGLKNDRSQGVLTVQMGTGNFTHKLGLASEMIAGDFEVVVEATQGVTKQIINKTVNAGEAITVSGTIMDASNQPIKAVYSNNGKTFESGMKVDLRVGNNNQSNWVPTDANGKYTLNVAVGSTVSVAGVSYFVGTTENDNAYTFEKETYSFGTITGSDTKDFTAKESTGSVKIQSANGKSISGATIASMDWYYQYQTTTVSGSTSSTKYTLGTTAPANYIDNTPVILGESDENGNIYFTYAEPKINPAYTGTSDVTISLTDYKLVNTATPTATGGYTFTTYVAPSAYANSDSQTVTLASQIDASKGTYNMLNGTISAKENLGSVTIQSANGNPIVGATISMAWYYQYQTTTVSGSTSSTKYTLGTTAPANYIGNTPVILNTTGSDKDGNIYFTYAEPKINPSYVAQSGITISLTDYKLVNIVAPTATGYTFTTCVAPSTYANSDSQTVTLASQIDASKGTYDLVTTSVIKSTTNTYLVSGNVGVEGASIGQVGGFGTNIKSDKTGNYEFYVAEGMSAVITPTLANNQFTPASFTTPSMSKDITVNFEKVIAESNPPVVYYEVVGIDGEVTFTYSIDGEEATSVVTGAIPAASAPGAKPVAKLELSAKYGSQIEVSATAENYDIPAFDGYSVIAVEMFTHYFNTINNGGSISGAAFDLTYTYLNEEVTVALTADENGIAKVSIPKSVSSTTFIASKDGKVVDMASDNFNVGLKEVSGKVVNLNDYYPADASATVSIVYGAVYNVEDVSYGPVAYESFVGTATSETVVKSIALKAPKIDNFEFVAWMVDGVVVSESADYTLVVEDGEAYKAVALYSAVHYEEPAEGLSMNVLVIGIVILILGILAVAYGIISKKQ